MAFLNEEIEAHQDRILSISQYSSNQFRGIYHSILKKITFIEDILISDEVIKSLLELTRQIDENDTIFVALAMQLDAKLWTGDMKLIKGLKNNDLIS